MEKTMQSNYLCVILHVKRKNINSHCFYLAEKIQDGDYVWWRHRPPAAPPTMKYTSSWREAQRLSTEGKNSKEGFHQPPSTLQHVWAMSLSVRPRVHTTFQKNTYYAFRTNCKPLLICLKAGTSLVLHLLTVALVDFSSFSLTFSLVGTDIIKKRGLARGVTQLTL